MSHTSFSHKLKPFTEPTLLPCPFCGVAGEIWNSYVSEWIAGCRNDKCHMMPRTNGVHKGDAVIHWNTRASGQTNDQALRPGWSEREK